MAEKKCYPKAIYRNNMTETMIVYSPYEHAKMCDQGWSGPPEFGSDVPDLEALIAKTESELEEMRKRLADMKRFQDEVVKSQETPKEKSQDEGKAPVKAVPLRTVPIKSAK